MRALDIQQYENTCSSKRTHRYCAGAPFSSLSCIFVVYFEISSHQRERAQRRFGVQTNTNTANTNKARNMTTLQRNTHLHTYAPTPTHTHTCHSCCSLILSPCCAVPALMHFSVSCSFCLVQIPILKHTLRAALCCKTADTCLH